MQRLCVLTAVLVAIVTPSVALDRPRGSAVRGFSEYPAHYWQQKLDHTDPHSDVTFTQRYFEVLDAWRAPEGPFILYIAGEGPQDGPAGVDDELAVIAKQTGAAVLTLEHRFFGKSLPFRDLTVEHLRYLTVEQELEDLAAFIRYYQQHVNSVYRRPAGARNKVLAIGGSYAGMVSSHLRYAHPELVDVAWSSSGVVDAVFNFTQFDVQVAISLGQKCASVLRRATEQVEARLKTDNARIKQLFGATGMSDDDLLWMLSDAETLPPQYGKAALLCGPMEAALDAGHDLVEALAAFCKKTFYPQFCAGAGPYLYSDQLMQNTTATEEWSAQRAWWWCCCNELAYAQTYPGDIGIRSPRINLDFHRRKCDAVYGPGVWPPNTEAFNKKYGGKTPKATNVVYINGSEDPWQWAGVRKTLSTDKPAYLMIGDNVGHCRDLHRMAKDDPIEVSVARKAAEQFVARLLK